MFNLSPDPGLPMSPSRKTILDIALDGVYAAPSLKDRILTIKFV